MLGDESDLTRHSFSTHILLTRNVRTVRDWNEMEGAGVSENERREWKTIEFPLLPTLVPITGDSSLRTCRVTKGETRNEE